MSFTEVYEVVCHAVQIWKPAVKLQAEKGVSFLVKDMAVHEVRRFLFAITVITATFASMTSTTIVVSPLISIPTAYLVIRAALTFFSYQLRMALDEDAIKVFKEQETIPTAVLHYVASSSTAVTKLLNQQQKPGDCLTKSDRNGTTLPVLTSFHQFLQNQ